MTTKLEDFRPVLSALEAQRDSIQRKIDTLKTFLDAGDRCFIFHGSTLCGQGDTPATSSLCFVGCDRCLSIIHAAIDKQNAERGEL